MLIDVIGRHCVVDVWVLSNEWYCVNIVCFSFRMSNLGPQMSTMPSNFVCLEQMTTQWNDKAFIQPKQSMSSQRSRRQSAGEWDTYCNFGTFCKMLACNIFCNISPFASSASCRQKRVVMVFMLESNVHCLYCLHTSNKHICRPQVIRSKNSKYTCTHPATQWARHLYVHLCCSNKLFVYLCFLFGIILVQVCSSPWLVCVLSVPLQFIYCLLVYWCLLVCCLFIFCQAQRSSSKRT